MAIVKKNMFSILCGVIAIIAIVAIFWPIGGMYNELQADVQKTADLHKQIDTVRTTPRKLPSLVLDQGVEQQPLTRLPNEKVIAAGLEKTRALTDQSNLMLKTVSDLNIHPLLQPDSLPRAEGTLSISFVNKYLERLGFGPEEWKAGLPAELNATRPPSPEEIQDEARAVWDKEYAVRVYELAGNNNLPAITQEFQEAVIDLPEQVKLKRASGHRMYLDDGGLQASADVQPGKPVKPEHIWFAQSVLWIQEDVVKAINAANGASKTVMTSPIKHLVSLRVPFNADQYFLPARAMGGGVAVDPAAVPRNADGVAEIFTNSPTGRVCNDLYDVVHFDLVMRVDYRKIPQILAELERNRLLTVLSVGVEAVNSVEERKVNGYVYGPDPVAEITLWCEALFLRSWTVDKEHEFRGAIMPELVMQTVGAKPGPGVQGGGLQGEPVMDEMGVEPF